VAERAMTIATSDFIFDLLKKSYWFRCSLCFRFGEFLVLAFVSGSTAASNGK
jgi:hypothetical protein